MTTINIKYRLFQYKILNNVLYLNKILFKFCKSADKTIIHLFSKCLCAQYIWNET